MILTNKQEQALKEVVRKFTNGDKYVVISGYAGSGKSTLIKYAVAALDSHGINADVDVCYSAFTGKACQVLLSKGNKNVSTLHKLLYESIPKATGGFIRKRKRAIGYKIVVVDECSMAPKELVDLLLSHDAFVIFCGDPGQLPPIDKDSNNHLLDTPDVFLDEVMRQALDSDIIRLSMGIREGRPLDYQKSKDVIIMPKKGLNTGVLQWADQILVGTNKVRVSINNQMRDLLGREGGPQDGDKVICTRNYWDCIALNDDPLVNGTIGYIANPFDSFVKYPHYLYENEKVDTIIAGFTSDIGADFGNLEFDKKMILTGTESMDWKSKYKIGKNKKYGGTLPLEFLYGYAITVHKAQGSEWDKVLVMEEQFPFDKEEHKRWLYTACTRCSSRLVLIR